MHLDVIDLQSFYASPLGKVSARLIRGKIRALWPNVNGATVVGLGYAPPIIGALRGEAERVIALMPAPQGVIFWPRGERNLAGLVEDTEIPLPDASVDRFLVVHSLEHCRDVRPTLREIWRVLAPGGRVGIVVPNRRGIWARLDRTPFGHGHPYSKIQLRRLLVDCMFTPLNWSSALHMPPSGSRLMLRALHALEAPGQRLWRNFAGVLIVEAEKRIYAARAAPRRSRVKKPAFIRR